MEYCIGVDLGGTSIKTGVVDPDCKIIGRASLPTMAEHGSEAIMDSIVKTVYLAAENAGVPFDKITHVGVGSPGTINGETGILEFSGNLNLHKFPLAAELESRLGCRVSIENDANAAAFGEAVAGAAKNAKNAVVITLGTGVGSGIIINGKIYSGFNYAGAEFGHTVIVHDGVQCNCGRRGCWEVYASASALIRQTQIKMIENRDSVMWDIVGGDIEAVNGKTAFDGMRAEDTAATEVVHKYISYVACGVVNVINIFQPDIVCIGGGICYEGETLMAPLRNYIKAERFSKYSEKQTSFVTAELGNDAGIIGAAYLHRSAQG
ncbi:MAG: ROK family protein [Clostridia bacterium]|nr:ROK family protein [Clostridia bacterium]